VDALIAACAVLKNASLATDNISEFEYFVAHGLQLCESTKFAFALGILVSACKQFAHGLKSGSESRFVTGSKALLQMDCFDATELVFLPRRLKAQ